MPASSSLELKRHYSELSEKETADVIEIVAEMFVTFIKGKQKSARQMALAQEQLHERKPEVLSHR